MWCGAWPWVSRSAACAAGQRAAPAPLLACGLHTTHGSSMICLVGAGPCVQCLTRRELGGPVPSLQAVPQLTGSVVCYRLDGFAETALTCAVPTAHAKYNRCWVCWRHVDMDRVFCCLKMRMYTLVFVSPSFLRCVASPFHSFVTIHWFALEVTPQIPGLVRYFSCGIPLYLYKPKIGST